MTPMRFKYDSTIKKKKKHEVKLQCQKYNTYYTWEIKEIKATLVISTLSGRNLNKIKKSYN